MALMFPYQKRIEILLPPKTLHSAEMLSSQEIPSLQDSWIFQYIYNRDKTKNC